MRLNFLPFVYEKVRYGNMVEPEMEYQLFLKSIDKKKTEFKKIHRVLLEEGKIEAVSRLKNIFRGFKSK